MDQPSVNQLEKIFAFVVDATDAMGQNAASMVRNFVTVLHTYLVKP